MKTRNKSVFVFKINNTKLEDATKIRKRLNKIIQWLISRYCIEFKNVELFIGTIDDDFIYNRSRLRITFK